MRTLTTGTPCVASESGSALPVGWARMSPRRSSGASHEGGQTGRRAQRSGAHIAGPAQGFDLVWRLYAAAFFAGFGPDFGVAFLPAFPLSFAANSCLTVAEMASTSTL